MQVSFTVTLLWSLAVFLASVFAALIATKTLKPKIGPWQRGLIWTGAAIVSYGLTVLFYKLDLSNDLFGILGLTAIMAMCVHLMYRGSTSEKLFVSLMAALIANVSTFMLCGTTDAFLGAKLGYFDCGTPYNVPNILLFIGIKLFMYSIIYAVYWFVLRKRVKHMMEQTGGNVSSYLIAPLVSVIAFYTINYVTNTDDVHIMPGNPWFFPLYIPICLIFVFEYLQIAKSVEETARALNIQKEKERIGAELNVATQIQADMLPGVFPPFPDRGDFDIYATMTPAKEVGGDFYDFFLVDENHIAMVMADVSGKGVPAALFMVIAKTLIKDRTLMGGSPSEILYDVNNHLCEGNKAELFVTVWLAIVDLTTGRGVAANAGHEHPVIRRKGGEFELVRYRHSPAVASMEGVKFREHEFEMNPGDQLFVYTDGVPEATNIKDEMYGTDRMLEVLNRSSGKKLTEILPALRHDIAGFVGTAPQFDDITMLMFDYYGKGGQQNG